MVRNYSRLPGSRPYKNYTEKNLANALQAVREGRMSQNKLFAKHEGRVGHPTILTQQKERLISETINQVADWGFPVTASDAREIVQKYVTKEGRNISGWPNNRPGPDFEKFITRNNISIRLASNIKHDPGAKKVLVRRGTKRVEKVQEHSRSAISVMVCGSANGILLPPMVVYKANNIYENWTVGGPLGAVYDNISSGWFDMNLFEVWFFKLLLPHVKENCNGESVVLLGVNLASHFSPTVVKAAKENNIYVAPLTPNLTHFMQPLDVAFFAPMKKKWRAILDDWRKTRRVKGTLLKEHFPNLLNHLWRSLQERVEENLKSEFRATGICPYDPQQPLSKLPKTPIDASTSDILNDSLLEFLQETRGQSSTNPKRKRGRKIIPGKEVDCEETKEEQLARQGKTN
ncbi:uncharacterized protein LOC126743298 [Anthonomus grandis grandis]|uniref:uncharacterized protein LOC126743298 n=1 Tax=Anthonomus grandis grandis TaxID=2921223 RepID=UPI0021666E49|nr:uncharacterized protein LOC126743298 [Anthonomus grandis grandis]